MASPLFRNLFNDFPSLRGKRQKPLDPNVKAPTFDPASKLARTKEPCSRNLRPRHTEEDAATSKANCPPSGITPRSCLPQHKAVTQDISKPLPLLPSRFSVPRKSKRIKKRKLPRAITERNLPHSKSKLHLSTVPGQYLASPPKAIPLQAPRFASPFDDLSDHEQRHDSTSSKIPNFQELDAQICAQSVQSISVEYPIMDYKPTSFERLKEFAPVSTLTQPSAWLASSLDSRVLEYSKETCATVASAIHQPCPKTEPQDFIESSDEMDCDQVVESTEVENLALCGHPLAFHPNQQTIEDCSNTPWNNMEAILPSRHRSLSPSQALTANKSLSKVSSSPMISPPPSFRRSAARTSRLERSPTGFFSPRTSSALPLVPQRVSSESTLTSLDMDLGSEAKEQLRETSPTNAVLTQQLHQSSGIESPMPQAVSPCPPPRKSRLSTGTELGDTLPMLDQNKSLRYLNPEFATALSDSETNTDLDNADFFTTYYEAMANGTEHSWTLALLKSDLGDKAVSDALLSNLPEPLLSQHLQRKTMPSGSNSQLSQNQNSSQMDGTPSDHPSVYTFGSTANNYNAPLRRSGRGGQVNTSPTKKTILQGRELRELELLSPIHEERESQSSLLAPRKTTISSSTQGQARSRVNTPIEIASETSPCDPCQTKRGSRRSNQQSGLECDKGEPAGTKCTTTDTQCSCSGASDVTTQSPPAQLSMTHRQRLLVHILATAGTVYEPFARIQRHCRPQKGVDKGHASQLTLGRALDAVMDTVRAAAALLAREPVNDDGTPVHPGGQTAYYGALALVLASVIALESAATAAEVEGGVMLRLKTSREAAHVEFANRVFEVLAAFGADKVGPAGGGATLGVLEACVAHVDEALWRLWEQMEGGQDENGMAMGDEIHWDVMVEVARELLCRGFVDVGKLAGARLALEKAARLDWMQPTD